MRKQVIIVAGGSGTRMGGGIPKQFRSLCGRPVLWWSMKAFHDADAATDLILVLPEDFMTLWQDFFSTLPEGDRFPHKIATGGITRGESVKNGLALIDDEESLTAVHDGARPLVTVEMINEGWRVATEKGAAIPVVPVTDSLRRLTPDGSESVNRNDYVAVQTPQVFFTGLLKECYRKVGDKQFSDDAAVVEKAGHRIALYKGDHNNLKITNPKDLHIAEVLCRNS